MTDPPTRKNPMTKPQTVTQGSISRSFVPAPPLDIGHCSLVIHWALGIGHGSFSPRG